MEKKIKGFLELNTLKQLEFLKKGEFPGWEQEEKIAFLKCALRSNLSSKTTAAALKILRELKYNDKYFFRKFLFHIDSSVANAARKAVNQKIDCNESQCAKFKKMFREGDASDRELIAKHFLEGKGRLNEDALISLLSFNDLHLREIIVSRISMEHELDEAKLTDILKSGGSLAWYVRSTLVEILGKRKSKYLLDIMDHLVCDENVEVRFKLVGALAKLEADKTRFYMQILADDAIIWVRKEARRALQTM